MITVMTWFTYSYIHIYMIIRVFLYIRERAQLILRQLTGASAIEVLFSKNIQRNGISEYFVNTILQP